MQQNLDHKCNKILTISVIIWLTIDVINFNHKCDKCNIHHEMRFIIAKGGLDNKTYSFKLSNNLCISSVCDTRYFLS